MMVKFISQNVEIEQLLEVVQHPVEWKRLKKIMWTFL